MKDKLRHLGNRICLLLLLRDHSSGEELCRKGFVGR